MELYHDLETAVASSLQSQVSETVFNLWFKDLVIENMHETDITLSTVSSFKANILMQHHLEKIERAFLDNLGFEVHVTIISRETNPEDIRLAKAKEPDPDELAEEEEEKREKEEMTRRIESSEQVEGYTFDNFIVGDSNRFAHAACFAVAQSFTEDEEVITDPLEERINPLFIYGQSGLGKTHLLYAVTNEIKKRTPKAKIIYIRGEDFVNELVSHLQSNSMAEFRHKYRTADVLLIDDVHFIAGKEAIQEEFFNTFNTLHDAQKQIILTSDRPPREIQRLADRLRTRFEWGLIADIQPPTPELRAAIIQMKANKVGISLSSDIISFLSNNIKSNIRTIEGAILRLYAMNKLTRLPITLDSAKRILQDVQSGAGEASYIIDRIFNVVSRKYDVSVDDIKGKRRLAPFVAARRMCMYLIRTLTNYPLTDIGSIFSCNHANVILACNNLEKDMEENRKIKEDYDYFLSLLEQK